MEINSYKATEIKRELNQRQTLQNDYYMNTITGFLLILDDVESNFKIKRNSTP